MSKPALNVEQMSAEERLELIEELWESLSETSEAVPITEAQRQELDRRLDDLETSAPDGIPWEEVLRRIRTRAR
jgi:putative addiction module component (TIGR02574 family)